MPKRSPTRRDAPPRYLTRGRVELAWFNCPQCNTLIRFRARLNFRVRCPKRTCTLVIYVGLALRTSRREGGRIGRPVDTILPPLAAHGTTGLRGTKGTAIAEDAPEIPPAPGELIDPLPEITLSEWSPPDPLHSVVDDESGENFIPELP